MMFKKFISLLAATAMTVTAVTGAMSVSVVSAADDYPTSGKCGEDATWLINSDGVLIISGTGEMSAYADDQSKYAWGWYGNIGNSIDEIVVEDGITVGGGTSLNQYAFGGTEVAAGVSKITFPPSLTKLNRCLASYTSGYKNLKDVYVYSKNISDASTIYVSDTSTPWSGSGIIWHVYKGSTTETSLKNDLHLTDEDIEYIPDDEQMPTVTNKTPVKLEPVTETSGPAGPCSKYEWRESSKTLEFSGKGGISIADDYKQYAEETEHIVIEEGITSLNANTGIPSKVHGAGATSYYCGSFTGFTSLKDVKLPETLQVICDSTFLGDENLEEINFPENLKAIGESAFGFCSKLKSINLHEGITIGGGAFTGCESLKEVTIPKNVTFEPVTFGGAGLVRAHSTFSNCTGIEKVVIEDGSVLKDTWGKAYTQDGIPTNFCTGCSLLKTVIIKGDVDYIAEAFRLCTSLTDIYLYNLNLKTITHAKGSPNGAFATNNLTDPNNWLDSFWTGNNPTFHVVKGSQTEETLRNAGYLNDENTEYFTDFTALDEKIKEAENLDTSNYTDASVTALKSAIENGKTVLNNENATQDEVDNAVKAINAALSGLAKKSAQSAKPSTTTPNVKSQAQKNAENAMKQAKITKLTVKSKAKKKITVTWKKVSKANGYQVQVSTNKKFKKSKIILTKTTSKKKITIKKLKSKKTYFVRVRAYATYKDSNGKPQKVYSSWIKKTRKVKVK